MPRPFEVFMAADSAVAIFIEGGMLAIATLSIIGAGIWKLSDVRDELKEAIEEHKKEVNDDLVELREQFAETISAIREKVVQTEFYIRDNYVRKDSFNIVVERLLAEFKSMRETVENKFLRLESDIKDLSQERIRESRQ